MAFDEQDRFDHTETDNHVNEQNQTAGTAQNEGTEGSGLYRMTREDLKNSTLYTDTDRRSEYTSGTAYENRTNTAHTGSDNFHSGPEKHHSRRKGGFGKTVVKAACLGVVFGLAASAVMFGVNKATGVSASASGSGSPSYNVQIVKTSAEGVATTDSNDVSDIVANVMPGIVAVNTTVESTSTDWFGRQYTQESKGAGSGIRSVFR